MPRAFACLLATPMLLGRASPAAALVYVPTEIPAPGGGSIDARSINEVGQVAGTADVGGGVEHAVRFDAAPGVLADLGTLGGSDSSGWGVNAAGEAAGTARISGVDGPLRAWGRRPPCPPIRASRSGASVRAGTWRSWS